MTEHERLSQMDLRLRARIWEDLSQNAPPIELLLDDLGDAVSNGLFGVAAALSDQLRVLFLQQPVRPEWIITLELEHMKRLYYMGYVAAARRATARLLALLQELTDQFDPKDANWFRFNAIGHRAWGEDDRGNLEADVDACARITAAHVHDGIRATMVCGFQAGLEGRRLAVEGDVEGSIRSFEQGIGELKDFARAQVHLRLRFAEHMMRSDRPELAVEVVKGILEDTLYHGAKSHLLLRSILLLLKAPHDLLEVEEVERLRHRAVVLVRAMGLARMHTLYPLLDQASELLPDSQVPVLDQLDRRIEIEQWLWSLTWPEMEKVVKAHYECRGFKVQECPKNEQAFDLLATKTEAGFEIVVAIQVKHYSQAVPKAKLPSSAILKSWKSKNEARRWPSPTHFCWHASSGIQSGADEDLRTSLELVFGHQNLQMTTLDDLVKECMESPLGFDRIFEAVRGGAAG